MKYNIRAREILKDRFESLGHSLIDFRSEKCNIVPELYYFSAGCKHCGHKVYMNIKDNETTIFRIDDENLVIAFEELPYGPKYKICPTRDHGVTPRCRAASSELLQSIVANTDKYTVLRLENYTWTSRELLTSAQELADTMCHESITITHIRAAVWQLILTNELLEKTGGKFRCPFPKKLVAEFKQLSNIDKNFGQDEQAILSGLPRAAGRLPSFTLEVMDIMARTERRAGNDKVHPGLLLEEILHNMRTK